MRAQEDHYWWFVSRRLLALKLVKTYGPSDPTILDVGSGTGAVMAELAPLGPVYGVDFSSLALEFSRERGLMGLVHGDAQALPFASGSFDVVVSLDTIEHLPDDRAAVAEIFRVLRPGGVFVMNVPAFAWLWGPHDIALMHFRRYRVPEVATLLASAGFELEKISYSVFFLFPIVVVRRFLERLRRGPAAVSLPRVSRRLNDHLIGLMDKEAQLFLDSSLPWGSSVVAVGRKPGRDSPTEDAPVSR